MIKMEHKQAPRVATGKLMSHAMQNARLFLAAVVFALWPDAGWAQAKPGQIDAILSRVPGNTWTALVENDSGSVTYYQHDADLGFAPASNTKLFTTAAAFGLLGSNYVFATRIYCDGPLTHGVLHGNLNLVCEHDPTWNSSVFTNARVPLNHIAARLKALGLTSVGSNVQCYGVCAYNFFTTNNLSATTRQIRNAAAAAAFSAALQAQGITVSGKAAGQTGFTTPGRLFYTHHSSDLAYQGSPLRLDIACIPLLKTSHNVMADLLCRHLGWKLAGRDTYLAGSAQVLGWLKETADLGTNGMVMNDGSGFSRSNRFSARQCVSLVRYMLAAFPTWEAGLPVGGVDGTIRSRFGGTDAASPSLRVRIALSV